MIPIQVITMMDSPTREVRDFVRQIATEDGTTFNMAMRGYEAMVGLIKRVANSEKEDKSFHEQGFAFRILEARKTFKYPLLRTVRSISTFSATPIPSSVIRDFITKPACSIRCSTRGTSTRIFCVWSGGYSAGNRAWN